MKIVYLLSAENLSSVHLFFLAVIVPVVEILNSPNTVLVFPFALKM